MKHIAQVLAAQGRDGDTELLHVAPWEVAHLRGIAQFNGGDLTRNPKTGLMEASFFTKLRDAAETAGALAANYYLPGSSLITSHLTSQGSQKQLNSQAGQLAQLGTGAAGAGVGSSMTNIPQSPVFGGPVGVEDAATGTSHMVSPAPGWQTMGGAMMAHPYMTAAGIAGLGMINQPKAPPAPTHQVHMVGVATPNSGAVTQEQLAWNQAHPQGEQYYINPTPGYTTTSGYDVTRPGYAGGGSIAGGNIFNAPLMPQHPKAQYSATGGLASFLHGPGDGMSDSIPASIMGHGKRPNEPIKVADGEYVVPADAVSHIGNGSSNAGAKKLDKMVTGIRTARTGKKKQAPQITSEKYMPR